MKEQVYAINYTSPIGNILIAAQDNKIIGLWIENQENDLNDCVTCTKSDNIEILNKAVDWLDKYFNGENPNPKDLSLNPKGTEFRKSVWKILTKIPYGKVITYNNIAKIIAKERGIKKMSAQAVGNAVGHNPISIIIPCHRVIGSNHSLVGYAGGLELKKYLLNLEKANPDEIYKL